MSCMLETFTHVLTTCYFTSCFLLVHKLLLYTCINKLLAGWEQRGYLQFTKLAVEKPIRGANSEDKLSRLGSSSYFLILVNHITDIK
jgi:hypothetical protein